MRSLVIQGFDIGRDPNALTSSDALAIQDQCSPLLEIIPLLEHVHNVTLKNFDDTLEWANIARPLQNILLQLISRPSITKLSIVSVYGLPLFHILQDHGFEHLEIRYASL